MTTKTAQRTALVQAADEARAQLAALREQARAFATQHNQRRDELRALAARSPEMFDEAGKPRKGSEAEKLARKIEPAEDNQFPGLLHGAQQRVRAAELAVNTFTGEHAVELARELEAPAEAAVAEIKDAIAALDAGCSAYVEATAQISAVVGAVQGLNGQDIRTDPVVDRLREIVRVGSADIVPPYSRSLTPKPGETPPRIRNGQGHYLPLDGASFEQIERAGLAHLWRGKIEEAAA